MSEEAQAGRMPERDAGQEKERKKQGDLYYWLQALVMALCAIILLFTFVVRIIGVVGSSMLPTLTNGDLLLVQSIGYTHPQQGDVVVLTKESFMDEPIVKRIIAVGGQRVDIDYDAGTVSVDGEVLNEPYILETMLPIRYEGMTSVVVPEGSIFVMGDNRNNSSDSRSYALGCVDERYIIGRVLWVMFPFGHFGAVK